MVEKDIQILYQDKSIIAVNKPVDLPVHKNDFMANDAPYLTKLIGDKLGKWIYNVHRLDSKTSGVIVLSLTPEIAKNITLQFERKEVEKTYYALVLGEPGQGVFDAKVTVKKKSKFKKPARTNFTTLKTFSTGISYKDTVGARFSLVEIKPETGRWHQIRQHFAQNRHDIIGDTHHGDFTFNKIITAETSCKRLFLHAGSLVIHHPVSNEKITFEADLPDEFKTLMEYYNHDK